MEDLLGGFRWIDWCLKRGFQLRLKVKDGGRTWFALLPEMCGNGGWVDISRKFWAFCGWKRADGRSYKDVANIGG